MLCLYGGIVTGSESVQRRQFVRNPDSLVYLRQIVYLPLSITKIFNVPF